MLKSKLAIVLVTALLASCSSVPTRTFEVRAVNAENEPVKCVVVVDRKWPTDAATATLTPGAVNVPFTHERMTITVKAVTLDEDGKIKKIPTDTSRCEYLSQTRDIDLTDPRVHLFILSKDNSYDG